MEIPPDRLKDLESHSQMLGQISCCLDGFIISDETTTLDGVRLLRAKYDILRAEREIAEIEKKYFDQ